MIAGMGTILGDPEQRIQVKSVSKLKALLILNQR